MPRDLAARVQQLTHQQGLKPCDICGVLLKVRRGGWAKHTQVCRARQAREQEEERLREQRHQSEYWTQLGPIPTFNSLRSSPSENISSAVTNGNRKSATS